MKALFLILPLAACAPYVDPCLPRPLENYRCVEVDRTDHPLHSAAGPSVPVDGPDHGDGSSDDNGDVSDG